MCLRPLPDQTSSCLGTNVADRHPTRKVKLGSLSLVFGMKMHRLVLGVEHLNDDPKNIEIAGILFLYWSWLFWPNQEVEQSCRSESSFVSTRSRSMLVVSPIKCGGNRA